MKIYKSIQKSQGSKGVLQITALVGVLALGGILQVETAEAALLCRGNRSAGATHVPQGCGNKRVQGRNYFVYCDLRACPSGLTLVDPRTETNALQGTQASRHDGRDTRYGVSPACSRILTSCQRELGLAQDSRAGNLEGVCTQGAARIQYNATHSQGNRYAGPPSQSIVNCMRTCCTDVLQARANAEAAANNPTVAQRLRGLASRVGSALQSLARAVPVTRPLAR